MGYPTDEDFEEARRHRAPPRQANDDIIDVAVTIEPEPIIHVTNVGPHGVPRVPDPAVVDEVKHQLKQWMNGLKEPIEPLTFDQLRQANIARLPLFKNAKGEPAHSQSDGSDWTNGDWVMAVTGELGELANILKKVLRGDLSMDEAKQAITDELADVTTYLDILAMRLDVNLGEAVRSKFNRVSDRVGCDVKL